MKKLFFITITSLMVCYTGIAQKTQDQLTRNFFSISPLKSPNQQIIEQIVNGGVFVIKQSYELSDSADNRYGLNGNRAFGTDYSLAIKVKNGFIITERTIHPWEFNPLYDQYKDKYRPKLFSSVFSEISETARYDSITIIEDSLKAFFSGVLYTQKSELFFRDGFSVGGKVGDNDGWIVWFTKKKGADFSKNTDLNLSIVKKELSVSQLDNDFFYSIDSISTIDEIIGGIFVIPEITGVGHLEMKLCGIICHTENKWMLFCPFIKSKDIFGGNFLGASNPKTQEISTQKLTPNQKEDDVHSMKSNKSKKKQK